MERIILSHKTALYYIRKLRSEYSVRNTIFSVEEIIYARKKYGEKSLDILVNSRNKKHRNWRYKYHIQNNTLPHNSITKLNNVISIVCPELLLIELAKDMPFEILCVISMELCGTYSMCPDTGEFVSNVKPVTSVEKINTYLKKFNWSNKKTWGLPNLRKACKFIADNSASPMESRLFVKLCGPRIRGLYGCTGLKFNEKVLLSDEAKKIAGQSIVIPDISSIKKKVAIEYNSMQFHENANQGQKDQRRRDALVHDGWKVYSFTPEQVYDVYTFKILAFKILTALGQSKRIRIKNFDELNCCAFDLLK